MSPDGTKMAYATSSRLYLRSMSELEARPIREATQSANVSNPVFSPDGESIAFWSGDDRALKRIAVSGGVAVTICDATNPFGMAWGPDGIVFTQAEGIMRVSANGGQPERLVDAKGEEVMNSPQMLPDAQTLLFTLGANVGSPDRWDQARVVVQSLGSGERKTLIEGGSHARYVPTGHLVYARGGVLFAVPFDLKRLEVTGGSVPIVEGVWRDPFTNGGAALFSVSDAGSLAYVPGPTAAWSAQSRLALINREGVAAPLRIEPGLYAYPRVSPDSTRLALGTNDRKEAVVSIYELSGASAVRRITFGGNNRFPIWSADSQRVAFQSDREGDPAVLWQPAIGGTAERLTKPDPGTSHTPESWSPDGEVLLFSATKDLISSLWTFSLKDRKATPFSDVKGSSLPTNAMFSPDGRWVAYQIGQPG